MRGTTRVARDLGVSYSNLSRRAAAEGISTGEVRSRVRAVDVAAEAGVTLSALHRAAEADGATTIVGAPGRNGHGVTAGSVRLICPKWAAQYVAEQQELQANWALRDAGWISTLDAARKLGVSDVSIRNGLQGRGVFAAALGNTRTAYARQPNGHQKALLINPEAVDAAVGILREHQHLARTMVPAKELAVELGLTVQGIRRRAERLGGYVNLLRGGAIVSHVSAEDADVIRAQGGPRTQGRVK